jgi:ribosomal protein L15
MLALFAVCLIRKRFYRISPVKAEALAAQKPSKLTPEISVNEEKKQVVAEKTEKTEIELPKIKDIKELQQEKPSEAPPVGSVDIEKEGVRIDGLMERAEKIGKVAVDMEKADNLITDALARDLVKRSEGAIKTTGVERGVINVDTLSEYFYPGERVDINILKRRGLIPNSVSYLKVLARGRIDKPLSVYANEFTPAAVKMIVLCGGEAIKAQTVREKDY